MMLFCCYVHRRLFSGVNKYIQRVVCVCVCRLGSIVCTCCGQIIANLKAGTKPNINIFVPCGSKTFSTVVIDPIKLPLNVKCAERSSTSVYV